MADELGHSHSIVAGKGLVERNAVAVQHIRVARPKCLIALPQFVLAFPESFISHLDSRLLGPLGASVSMLAHVL
jgi:hypothetical protein